MSALVNAEVIAKEVLSVKAVATVLRLARDGKIPVVRITPNLIRFNPAAVRAALQGMEVPAK